MSPAEREVFWRDIGRPVGGIDFGFGPDTTTYCVRLACGHVLSLSMADVAVLRRSGLHVHALACPTCACAVCRPASDGHLGAVGGE